MSRLPANTFVKTIRALGLAGILPVLALAAPALAQGTPRSVGECERLKNDLAYNQCLAMFGPEARMITGGDGGGGPPPASAAGATAMAGIPSADEPLIEDTRRGRRGRWSRRGGRQVASFEVSGGSEEAAPARRSYRRWHRRR